MSDAKAHNDVPAGLHLRSALVCDVLDSLDRRNQALGPDIVPVQKGGRLIGPAFTVASIEVDDIPETSYVGLLRALDAVEPGHVFVLASERAQGTAIWGELLSATCQARGVRGTVTDGYVRDSEQIRRLGYHVFGRGTYPLDSHGRSEVTGFGEPVVIDGVVISPGDLIVADVDGVAVVPVALLDEVLERAAAKASGEDSFRAAVKGGMPPSQAYDKFQVL